MASCVYSLLAWTMCARFWLMKQLVEVHHKVSRGPSLFSQSYKIKLKNNNKNLS